MNTTQAHKSLSDSCYFSCCRYKLDSASFVHVFMNVCREMFPFIASLLYFSALKSIFCINQLRDFIKQTNLVEKVLTKSEDQEENILRIRSIYRTQKTFLFFSFFLLFQKLLFKSITFVRDRPLSRVYVL